MGAGHSHSAGPMGQMAMADGQETPTQRRDRMNFVERFADWLGRWHVSVVHFPIALLIVALLLEAWPVARHRPVLATATRVLVPVGAVAAVAAATLGWLAMGVCLCDDDWLHRSHRWLGTSVGVLALATWFARERSAREGGGAVHALYLVLLTLSGLAVAANGFLGGSMNYGMNHMAW